VRWGGGTYKEKKRKKVGAQTCAIREGLRVRGGEVHRGEITHFSRDDQKTQKRGATTRGERGSKES